MGASLEESALGAAVRDASFASKKAALQPGLPSPLDLASHIDMADTLQNFDSAAYTTHGEWPGFPFEDCHQRQAQLPAQLPSPPQTLDQSSDDQSDGVGDYFVFQVDPRSTSFIFELGKRSPVFRNAKRCRARHDVDGPRTAGLSCKKRRLRTELITSRLSQPFSLPATHIINREAVAAGDKRFMKLAASATATKRAPSSQGSLIRRAALLNCTRSHLQERMHESEGFLVSTTTQRHMLQRGQQQQQQNATGGRFWTVTAHPDNRQTTSRVWMIRSKPSEASSSSSLSHVVNNHSARSSSPVAARASGLDVSTNAARRLSRSPLLRPVPRSPILGPADGGRLDEVGEDEETAFPEDCGRYASGEDDDDSDDVYSDFGAIFGTSGAQDTEDNPEPSNENTYEDCLDELDGILGW